MIISTHGTTQSNYSKIVKNGLVMWTDAMNKNSYSGSGTVWNDLTGNNYSGSLTNGPTFVNDLGGYLSFDGTNDYVVYRGTDGFGTVSAAPAFTMCVWANLTNQLQHVAGFRNDSNFDIYFLLLGTNTEARVRTATGVGEVVIAYTNYHNKWTHIVMAVSSTTITLYLNGSSVGTAGISGTFGATSSNFYLARNPDANFPYWSNGKIANVHFYNRTLSATEVQQNYNADRRRFGL